MTIKVTFEFTTPEEARDFLNERFHDAPTSAPTCAAAKPKRKRRTKAEIEADAETPVEAASAATDIGLDPPVEPATLTVDDVRAALTKVSEKHGLEKCKELLTQFEVERISAVPPEKFVDFVGACNATL